MMIDDFRPGADDGTRHLSQQNENHPGAFAKLSEWWGSDACKELQKANREAQERAVGKYFMLSEQDKIDMVEAITYLMCKAEREGCSHRGVMDALGIYPAGFWVDHLMDVHNALWTYYHDKKKEQDLKDDLDALDNFVK